jgi:hypothetical protein
LSSTLQEDGIGAAECQITDENDSNLTRNG